MCSSSQGDQPFNITWLKDGAPIHSGGNSAGNHQDVHGGGMGGSTNKAPDPSLTINEYAPFSSILSIHNVTSRHNGNYTCRVTNRAGSVEYTAMLSVSGKLEHQFISMWHPPSLHTTTARRLNLQFLHSPVYRKFSRNFLFYSPE